MKKDAKYLKLEKEIEKQAKLIENYEASISLLRHLKKIPLLGGMVRFLANAIRVESFRGTRIESKIEGKSPEIIAVVNPFFRGVSSATGEMVKDIFFVTEIFSRITAKNVAKQILAYKPRKVLISGYAKGHELLVEELYKLEPELRIFVLVHSAFIWFDEHPSENVVFERFIDLAKQGIVEKIGFCKRDLAEYFKAEGVNTFFVMNRFYPEKHGYKKLSNDSLKIGIWGKNVWHRNITNQVIGGILNGKVEINVNEVGNHFFLRDKNIKIHGFLPKGEFLKLFSQMDINLYISLTECFPMTVIESMQYGIPCLVSDTSDVYKFSPYLKEKLTVSSIDSPLGISKKIDNVVVDYLKIQEEIKNYLPALKEKTEKSIEEFLK